jgi:molybdopterin-containing oxidoreductase family membrane subunit
LGSLSGALLVITFFARIFPIIPIEETILEAEAHTQTATSNISLITPQENAIA